MCGIYGSTKKYSQNTFLEKLERISFRGPDFSDIKDYDKVVFGHNRLAIIDLDQRSNQPFDFGPVSITFNGEIYNFLDLKKNLIAKGHLFSTNSDTEVVCASYLEYGEDCLSMFNGMFAFVIYDRRNNILFGARDRVGQKPFYYTLKNSEFEFASQISSIAIGNSMSMNDASLSKMLLWKYIPEPDTIYQDVHKLKAGYCFTYDLDTKTYKDAQYWEVPNNYNSFQGDYLEAQEELKSILGNAVSRRMLSDVPLGIFLSGGIDSSIIASLAQEGSSGRVKTFSIGFEEEEYDESQYAEQMANRLGTDHLRISCYMNEGLELIKSYDVSYDEPFSDSSAIPTMLLSKYTREHVTVALSGDGGDENFIGYHMYPVLEKFNRIYKIPFVLRKAAAGVATLFPQRKFRNASRVFNYKNIEEFHYCQMRKIDTSLLIDSALADSCEYRYMFDRDKPILEKATDFDFKTFVAGDANTKVDRASMAYSLEVRSPFYDHEVIDFSRSLPTSFKYSEGNKKRILKDLLSNYIDDEEFLQRKKAGFTMPFALWFQNELKDYVLDELTDSNLKTIPNLNFKEAKIAIKEHIFDKSYNHYPKIWNLIVASKFVNK